jgi:hypothetical protein
MWMDGYVRAWRFNDPAGFTEPFRPPWRGREQIVKGWLARKDEPGEAAFEWRPVAIAGEVAVVQGTTR